MTSKTKPKKGEAARIIGRWAIKETLGKGGYSFVKKGVDIKTGKIVALKFMEKADTSWAKEQAVQVETEIEALKSVRHRNIMKLYAYNLNAQYPSATTGKYVDTILLVLEFAPGGELFDILYYTKSLDEKISRTYFRQIVAGVEACHSAGVIHRDLKPQNLLLDSNYNIKITDFGLSKIVSSDADAIMTTTYVGTKGYQAPELLRDESYDLKCDVFSVGVILFILLAGYPPFETATKGDKWFRSLHKKNYAKFWKAHHKCPIVKQKMAVKELLEHMLKSNPKKRASMTDVKKHPWLRGATVSPKHLVPVLRERHRMAEQRRRQDVRKMTDLAISVNPHKPIEGLETRGQVDVFPEHLTESVLDIYTHGKWWDVYNMIEEWVPDHVQGSAVYDFAANTLRCQASVLNTAGAAVTLKFDVKVYASREWANRAPAEIVSAAKGEDKVFVVRVILAEGDRLVFNKIKENFLLKQCSPVLKGLPDWAREMQRREFEAQPGYAEISAMAKAAGADAEAMSQDDQKEDGDDNNKNSSNSNSNNEEEQEEEQPQRMEEIDDYDNLLLDDNNLWAEVSDEHAANVAINAH